MSLIFICHDVSGGFGLNRMRAKERETAEAVAELIWARHTLLKQGVNEMGTEFPAIGKNST